MVVDYVSRFHVPKVSEVEIRQVAAFLIRECGVVIERGGDQLASYFHSGHRA